MQKESVCTLYTIDTQSEADAINSYLDDKLQHYTVEYFEITKGSTFSFNYERGEFLINGLCYSLIDDEMGYSDFEDFLEKLSEKDN